MANINQIIEKYLQDDSSSWTSIRKHSPELAPPSDSKKAPICCSKLCYNKVSETENSLRKKTRYLYIYITDTDVTYIDVHSFISDINIAPLQVKLLRGASDSGSQKMRTTKEPCRLL